jgi:hypothetical protein
MSTAGKVGRGIGKVMKWTIITFAFLIVVIVIIVIVAIGKAGSNSNSSASHVTAAKYATIHTGQTASQVEAVIGVAPESTDSNSVAGETLNCIYYGVLSTNGTYQFCFTNGKLTDKSRYGG